MGGTLTKILSKFKYTEEEESKFDNPPKPSVLEPCNSIFGKSSVKTVMLQQSPSQSENIKKNEKTHEDPFNTHSPFVKFPNISSPAINIISGPTSNAFFDAFFLAYTLHGELVLSPDDIWLQINNCFSTYVKNNAEDLRSKIVNFKDKKDLIVTQNNQYGINDKSFRWDEVLSEFKSEIKKNTVGDISDIMECDFSTTGVIEKIASQISLMHCCENFFNYRLAGVGCGIQKVHFLGDEKDWVHLKAKLQNLKKYEVSNLSSETFFSEWIKNVDKILENFIETYRNKANVKFWNTVIQEFEGYELKTSISGGRYYELSEFVNGWILNFFLYDKDNRFFMKNLIDQPLEEPDLDDYYFSPKKVKKKKKSKMKKIQKQKGTNLECFPAAVWKAPVLIEYVNGPRKDEKIPVHFLGGFSGVAKEQNIYRPQTSFVQCN